MYILESSYAKVTTTLEHIHLKCLSHAPSRLQRLLLKNQTYDSVMK